ECARLLQGLRDLGVAGLAAPPPAELSGFLDRKLRRSAAKPHVQLSIAQEALHTWLEAQCRSAAPVIVRDVPAASTPIDAVLAEYEAAFAYHIEHGRVLGNRAANERMERIEQALAAQVQERAQHAAERERWLAEMIELHHRRDAEQARADTLVASLA